MIETILAPSAAWRFTGGAHPLGDHRGIAGHPARVAVRVGVAGLELARESLEQLGAAGDAQAERIRATLGAVQPEGRDGAGQPALL
jgi:hypothetical protein